MPSLSVIAIARQPPDRETQVANVRAAHPNPRLARGLVECGAILRVIRRLLPRPG